MAIATVRGLNINYEIVGDAGPWVALITGGRRGYQEFLPLAGKIAAKGFRVLLHDRRNTGASDIELEAHEVEEATWADDLRDLLDQLGAAPGGGGIWGRAGSCRGCSSGSEAGGRAEGCDDGEGQAGPGAVGPRGESSGEGVRRADGTGRAREAAQRWRRGHARGFCEGGFDCWV